MESRVTVLEYIARATRATLERIERRFDTIDRKFESMERKFDAIDRRFDGVDRRFQGIDRRVDALAILAIAHRTDFRWLLGIMLGGFGALLGVMARGFHWL